MQAALNKFVLVKIDGDKDRQARAEWAVEGFPTLIFLDNTGKEITRVVGAPDAGGLIHYLETVLKQVGTAPPPAQVKKQKEALERGRAAMEAKRYADAARAFRAAIDAQAGGPQEAEARRGLEEIDRAGAEAIAAAETRAAEKDFAAAVDALRAAEAAFAGTATAEIARARADAIENGPETGRAVRAARAEKKAAAALSAAEDLFAKKDYLGALQAFRALAREFPATPSGEKSAARAREIEADADLMAQVRDAEIRGPASALLRKARNFYRNGMKDKGDAAARRVIEEYPGTKYAREAEEVLKTGR